MQMHRVNGRAEEIPQKPISTSFSRSLETFNVYLKKRLAAVLLYRPNWTVAKFDNRGNFDGFPEFDEKYGGAKDVRL